MPQHHHDVLRNLKARRYICAIMLTAFIRFGDGRYSTDSDRKSIENALRDPKALFWVDMTDPSAEELTLLDEVFGFHPLAIEDTIQHVQRPKIENYCQTGDACKEGYFYMVIHGPDLETFRHRLRTKELDMFVSERYLVTIHDDRSMTIDELATRGKADPRVILDPGIDVLLYNLIDKVVDHYLPIFDHLQEEIDSLEDEALADPHPAVLTQIAQQKRDLLNLRRVIGPQREVLAQLTRGEVPFIRETTRIYFRDVQDHLNRAVETIELYRDLISGARDIYLSSISNNLNRIMKALTIITVIALPLNIITGFFGMNFHAMPGLDSPRAFWITVAIMIAAVTTMLMLFRKKRWL
ncbi:MAG TPA: magnesium/cobalt transporter CorA [Tepidisphaeraceae bacterium]